MNSASLAEPKVIRRNPPANEKFFRKSQKRSRPLLSPRPQKSPERQNYFHSSAVTPQ